MVLDSPEQRHEVEHLLRGLHAMHDRPVRCSCCPAISATRPPTTRARGWHTAACCCCSTPTWYRRRTAGCASFATRSTADVGAVGPKLLFDDGSIQHAGLLFPPRPRRRLVQRALLQGHAAALAAGYHGARGAGGDRRGAARPPRPVRSCRRRLRRLHHRRLRGLRLLPARARSGARILYVPSAELFHFERKSIDLHNGYAGTLACRYNRRLHHRRWDDAIEALMRGRTSSSPVFGEAA